MNNGIKNYTLDCGCFFEHSKKAGCNSFELTIVCDEHKGSPFKQLSLPPGLPPNPFLSVPQAGDVTHRVTSMKAMMEMEGPGLGKAEIVAEAIYEKTARAKGWQSAEDVEDGRLVVFHEELGIHVYSWREAVESLVQEPDEVRGLGLPQVQTNSRYEADVERAVDVAFQKSPFATALENGAVLDVLDELEHTQPIPPPYTHAVPTDVERLQDLIGQHHAARTEINALLDRMGSKAFLIFPRIELRTRSDER